MAVDVRGISTVVLDIEGTLCPIWFVSKVLYPYALKHLTTSVTAQWDTPQFASYKAAFPASAQHSPAALIAHFRDLAARDVKDPALKKLQGLIWRQGYEAGTLCVPLFPDVAPKLREWFAQGFTLAIFSSGSVEAQRLFFGYVDLNADLELKAGGVREGEEEGEMPTETGDAKVKKTEDLNSLFVANFDTVNAGSKVVATSYEKIVTELGKKAEECLFLSDNVMEIHAAVQAGLKALVVDRPGNAPLSQEDIDATTQITSLDHITLLP